MAAPASMPGIVARSEIGLATRPSLTVRESHGVEPAWNALALTEHHIASVDIYLSISLTLCDDPPPPPPLRTAPTPSSPNRQIVRCDNRPAQNGRGIVA